MTNGWVAHEAGVEGDIDDEYKASLTTLQAQDRLEAMHTNNW